jgi:hypothetical protein
MDLVHIEINNNMIYTHFVLHMKKSSGSDQDNGNDNNDALKESTDENESMTEARRSNDIKKVATHSGNLLIEATECPQCMTYTTNLKLFNVSRGKMEEIIFKLYNPEIPLI